jgi:alkylhydroperoxidase family enzyme
MPRDQKPRISPLLPDQLDDRARELLASTGTSTGLSLTEANIFTTLVRAPRLFRHWLPFGGALLTGKIPARERELLILRTGWNCKADYEWAQHVLIGLRSGLSAEEIARVPSDNHDQWDPFDATLLRAADELHEQFNITQSTWEALADRFDTEQLIEVPMLVGHYHLVAMTLNALGVELDEGLSGFPD